MSRHSLLGLPIAVIVISASFATTARAQLILNGSFENTSATATVVNPLNAQFNSLMSNVTAFGVREGIDIQTNGTPYGQSPQQGNWKISPASDQGGNTEAFSMTLSAPLVAGATYRINFYIEPLQSGAFNGGTAQIGLSTSATNFGTQIASSTAPDSGWALSSTDFMAPNAGSFLTVRLTTTQSSWVGLDNFTLIPVPEPCSLAIAGALAIGSTLRRRRRHSEVMIAPFAV